MLIHIVRHNERLNDILANYNITQDELRVNNLHISNLNNLIGGMKLKIPFLNSETLQILESTEPFIFDYYPSVNKVDLLEEIKEEIPEEEFLIDEIQNENILFRSNETLQETEDSQSENLKTEISQNRLLEADISQSESLQSDVQNNEKKEEASHQQTHYQNSHYQNSHYHDNYYSRRSIYPFYIKKK